MVLYLLSGKPRPAGYLKQEIIAAMIAIVVAGPFAYWATDRAPPQTRLKGDLVICPDVNETNQGSFNTCYSPNEIVVGTKVRVRFWTTKRLRECPGVVQQEIISSQNTIFSKLGRPVGPARWYVDPENGQDVFIGQEVVIPEQMAAGPAIFRSVTFRYCNWLQSVLHWPIVQSGPDITFMAIKPKE